MRLFFLSIVCSLTIFACFAAQAQNSRPIFRSPPADRSDLGNPLCISGSDVDPETGVRRQRADSFIARHIPKSEQLRVTETVTLPVEPVLTHLLFVLDAKGSDVSSVASALIEARKALAMRIEAAGIKMLADDLVGARIDPHRGIGSAEVLVTVEGPVASEVSRRLGAGHIDFTYPHVHEVIANHRDMVRATLQATAEEQADERGVLLAERLRLVIDGQWRPKADRESIDVMASATFRIIKRDADGNPIDPYLKVPDRPPFKAAPRGNRKRFGKPACRVEGVVQGNVISLVSPARAADDKRDKMTGIATRMVRIEPHSTFFQFRFDAEGPDPQTVLALLEARRDALSAEMRRAGYKVTRQQLWSIQITNPAKLTSLSEASMMLEGQMNVQIGVPGDADALALIAALASGAPDSLVHLQYEFPSFAESTPDLRAELEAAARTDVEARAAAEGAALHTEQSVVFWGDERQRHRGKGRRIVSAGVAITYSLSR